MREDFLVTYKRSDSPDIGRLTLQYDSNEIKLYCNSGSLIQIGDIQIFIDGYILPRDIIFDEYSKYDPHSLVHVLYKKFDDDFILNIKGFFCIIILDSYQVKIFNDQLGLYPCYYTSGLKSIDRISNSVDLLKSDGFTLKPDYSSIVIKSLIHRNVPGKTTFEGLEKFLPATCLRINDQSVLKSQYWKYTSLLELKKKKRASSFENEANFMNRLFSQFLQYLNPDKQYISLTGGKDSRTGLAALKSLSKNPVGFTYGNPMSRDVIYAGLLADSVKIDHYIIEPESSVDYFEDAVSDIVKLGNPDINLFRLHRFNAFKKVSDKSDSQSAYFAGYMAGEILMGIYYDNLIFTNFITDFWENGSLNSIADIAYNYFIKDQCFDDKAVLDDLHKLECLNPDLSRSMKQFHGLFEIGIPHHAQDIFISSNYFSYTYPFFLDIDLLEDLFYGNFNLFHTDNTTKNPFKRYALYAYNLNIQHLLFPQMDQVPFGKRGSYNTREYLRGSFYWSVIKTIRFFTERKTYPPSINYDETFRQFLLQWLNQINSDRNSELHMSFNIEEAISELSLISGTTQEGILHKYSNIVMLYMQLNYYK
ncbi:hypothetical protein ACE1ET_02910 [Saccharicrinis sp. FJH62]|uniref:hypothetical protein n=1 Tax=Saccharicrinis sp. FJH62 TaxID=3344657 RepID=UPI0035D5085C